jgi:hypothetical protein
MYPCIICGKVVCEGRTVVCDWRCALELANRIKTKYDKRIAEDIAAVFPRDGDTAFLKACGIAPL